jgi:hypothetical protein
MDKFTFREETAVSIHQVPAQIPAIAKIIIAFD